MKKKKPQRGTGKGHYHVIQDDADEEKEALADDSEEIIKFKCLTEILCKGYSYDETVSASQFGNVLAWFGPLGKAGEENIVDRIKNAMSCHAFSGAIDGSEAEAKLKGRPTGTFLVRLSQSLRGSFVLSRQREDQKILEGIFLYVPWKGFTVDNGVKYYSTLQRFLSMMKNEKKMQLDSCPEWEFAQIFNPSQEKITPKTRSSRKGGKSENSDSYTSPIGEGT